MKRLLDETEVLKIGTKCRLVHPKNRKNAGAIMVFKGKTKDGFYLFYYNNEAIVCYSDTEFIILPTLEELQEVINLTLDLGCKDLFVEYTDQLNNQNYNDVR
ncbi:hypothetical protein [Pontibacillus marinus]|uniref:Uncharacterized protein n=1 Tax=Pontibacillus marinus BH030004 = DSM 16465 TaxID=1385511 RepID=A0A0A5GL45_9BACI|nr:hypothetical protein [Pontibacillus marinus]KGX91885.1 hypothetical protein N783_00635 [Pontibacillus marinus BH030004 = DSM 16465]